MTPDDGHRNCPKHVEIYSKNIFEKLVHLVGFIIRIYQACLLFIQDTHRVYRNKQHDDTPSYYTL